ncbi:MAG: hypothetical protein CL583_04805 [Alteromonadaceae bacterium]|nr:hypothetical protein [Alteromonadaceae bacterium]|tara:strand:+ start:2870 stop:3589 length:720 start_codon:yes stop_codon:yes gene_type:complete
MKKAGLFLAAIMNMTMVTSADAILIDRGNGMIYDDVLDITWLQDANFARTSGYDDDGRMTWDAATNWAGNLVFGGYEDWRLPSFTDIGSPGCNHGVDCGWNVDTASSELAYMYYVNLGLQSPINEDGSFDPTHGIFGNGTRNGTDASSYGQNDLGLIKNIQAYGYWSGTELSHNSSYAWDFGTVNGAQGYTVKTAQYYAWAVRPGDTDIVAVPEPGTLLLLVAGLMGIAGARRGGLLVK